jgi:hypothetical protein
MVNGRRSRGRCHFCEREVARGGMVKHLATCAQRMERVRTVDQGSGVEQVLYHLLARDAWPGAYWLHLEMAGSAKLTALDKYLRAIWLECCGHLSLFTVGGWGGDRVPKSWQIDRVFGRGVELEHIYDFGTTSHTLVKFVGLRKGKPLTKRPIFLMARNDPPELPCMECSQPASWLCIECIIELNRSGLLCHRHAEVHPHDCCYGPPKPLVNSPRMGMCGYDGPAEPPF